MDNPYKDVIEKENTQALIAKKKQYFAHTDNNLKGISNLTKDEDLMVDEQSKECCVLYYT
jgi:hypothetical protein